MPNSLVTALMKEVAILRNDMEWIKKGIYLCTGASLAACLAVSGEIILRLIFK